MMDSRDRRTKSSNANRSRSRQSSSEMNQSSNTRRKPSSSKKRTRPQEDDLQYMSVRSNRAKSSPAARRREANAPQSNSRRSGRRGRQTAEERQYAKSKRLGVIMATVLAITSLIFSISLLTLNMLPNRYVAIILIVLILVDVILFLGQKLSKKRARTGKIITVILTIILMIGSFYFLRISGTLSSIANGSEKVDYIVVAVMDDDPAETIEDAAEYTFGAQFSMDGEHIEEAIGAIEEELGSSINVIEYDSMQDLAVALQEGEVEAIIYNEGHASFIEEENPDFATDIRIIYSYEITSELELDDVSMINVDDECFTVYISGIDVYGSISQTSRSDVNMLAVVNPTEGTILLVNTPRDYYVQFPGVTGDSYDKLTHAGNYGVDTSMATLEELYGIDIDFYTRVNFTSLIEMVDALGGISVYSEYSFTTIEHAGLYKLTVEEGYNEFDGTDALIFARERLNVPGGDNQRGINQQEVIKAMIDKATSPAIITSANSLLGTVSDNVETNMTDEQMQSLIKLQLNENIDWEFTSVSATGTGSNEYCYSSSSTPLYVTIPDYDVVDEISALIKEALGEVTEETEEETEETNVITDIVIE